MTRDPNKTSVENVTELEVIDMDQLELIAGGGGDDDPDGQGTRLDQLMYM